MAASTSSSHSIARVAGVADVGLLTGLAVSLVAGDTGIGVGRRNEPTDAVATEANSCTAVIAVIDGAELDAGVVENFESELTLIADRCSSTIIGLTVDTALDSTVGQTDT